MHYSGKARVVLAVFGVLCLGNAAFAAGPQKVTVSGYIRDNATGETLIGAGVVTSGGNSAKTIVGAVTNEFSEEYMNANNEEPEVNIDRSGDDNELKIDMLMPVCAVALHGSRLDSYFEKNTVYGYITIENDGSYKIGRLKEMLYGSGGYYETEFDRVFIEFSGETEMKLSATTIFPDYITTTAVTGRITMYFKCVSGKGKKK